MLGLQEQIWARQIGTVRPLRNLARAHDLENQTLPYPWLAHSLVKIVLVQTGHSNAMICRHQV